MVFFLPNYDQLALKLTQPKAPTPSKSTMSAQQRYSTLVKHICQIYSAKDDGVAELTTGLHDILSRINPDSAADWKKVQADSKRLLRVWHSCADDDDAAADEVVDQIAESLKEYIAGEVQIIAEKPVLEVSEVVAPPVYKTVVVEAGGDESDEEEEEDDASPLIVVKKAAEADNNNSEDDDEDSIVEPADDEEEADIKMLIEEADDEEVCGGTSMDIENGTPMDEDEVAEAMAAAEAEEEEEEIEAAAVVEEAKEKEEADKEAEAADSDDDAEEEADAEEAGDEEEAEEEEEGLEVEKRIIRGRPYWVDVNTNKLYAVIGDDDVGDEVGAIINGKPVFKAA